MTDRTCSTTACDRAYYAKGYCEAHWRRANRGKGVDTPVHAYAPKGTYGPVCNLDGCDRPHSAKGLCKSHHAAHRISQLTPEQDAERQERARLYRLQNRSLARRGDSPALPCPPALVMQRMAYWGHRCWICAGPFEAVDHVKPVSKGGWHALANLRPICKQCNTRKAARWPLTPGILSAIRGRRRWDPAGEARAS